MKVRDRLLKYRLGEARCVLSYVGSERVGMIQIELLDSTYESFHYMTRDLNCTFVATEKGLHTKIPGPNETYDGYVVIIHRDEADVILAGVQPDSLPGEPGKISPPFTSGDIIINVSKYPTRVVKLDLMNFLDLGLFIYIWAAAVTLFMVPIVYVYAETHIIDGDRHESAIFLLKKYGICCENMINLILDQEQFKPTTFVGHILALNVSIFTLGLVHGFILNSVGADSVTVRAPSPIDSLDDLLASNLTPVVIDKIFAYKIFESSPAGSKEHELWQRIQERKPKSIIVTDHGNPFESVGTIFEPVWKHKSAFLEIESTSETAKYVSCLMDFSQMYGKSSTGLHLAREHLSFGMMTWLMSHNIHQYTERVISTALRATFEAGLFDGLFKMLRYIVPASQPHLGLRMTSKTLECLEGQSKKEQVPGSLNVHQLKKFLCTWQYILCLAIIILALENAFSPMKRRRRRNAGRPMPFVIAPPSAPTQRTLWYVPVR